MAWAEAAVAAGVAVHRDHWVVTQFENHGGGLARRSCLPAWAGRSHGPGAACGTGSLWSADAHPVLIEMAVRLVIAGGQAAAAALATRQEGGGAGFPDCIRLGVAPNFINPDGHHAAADVPAKALDHGSGPGPDIQGEVLVQGSGSKRGITAFSTRGEILPRSTLAPPFQLVPFSGWLGFDFNSDG